jgi:hypothetical protein
MAEEFSRTPDACRAKAISAGLFSPVRRPRRGQQTDLFGLRAELTDFQPGADD